MRASLTMPVVAVSPYRWYRHTSADDVLCDSFLACSFFVLFLSSSNKQVSRRLRKSMCTFINLHVGGGKRIDIERDMACLDIEMNTLISNRVIIIKSVSRGSKKWPCYIQNCTHTLSICSIFFFCKIFSVQFKKKIWRNSGLGETLRPKQPMIVINWLCEIFEGAAFHYHFIQGPRLAYAVEAVTLGHNHWGVALI